VTGGLAIGGYLAARLGWRHAFLIFAAAGVAVAIIQVLIARDATRPDASADGLTAGGGNVAALRELVRNPTYLHLTLGYGWSSFATFGLVQWMPSFYNRQFNLPPEQAAGEAVDGRSDLFALGCVLFEMLTGDVAFSGPTVQATIARRFVHTPPPVYTLRPGVPPALAALVDHLLAKGADGVVLGHRPDVSYRALRHRIAICQRQLGCRHGVLQ
jgi:serine/threonine protein kinase